MKKFFVSGELVRYIREESILLETKLALNRPYLAFRLSIRVLG